MPYLVYCIAEIPTTVVDKFLSDALAGAEAVAPGSKHSFALVTSSAMMPSTASKPPVAPFTSSFIGQSPQDLLSDGVTFFAILDAHSVTDETALLVNATGKEEEPQTVRVDFDQAQTVLNGLEMGTLGFDEIVDIAQSRGGVYTLRQQSGPVKGQPAPPMQLGGGT